jgi:signal transduction histidine kinase
MRVDEKLLSWYRFHLFGRFILGVSHEIDNYLSVILGFSELLKLSPGNEQKLLKSVEKITGSAENLSRLIKKYSYYVRPQKDEESVFDISETIDELITFAGYDLKRNGVVLEKRIHADSSLLRGDRRNFAFMLLNVMVNASESMAQKGGEQVITVNRENDKIVTHIIDDGVGIPSELSEKIFDPGFTTKGEIYRLGLGLSVSKYLAEKIGGSINFTSKVGNGTSFEIKIPSHM